MSATLITALLALGLSAYLYIISNRPTKSAYPAIPKSASRSPPGTPMHPDLVTINVNELAGPPSHSWALGAIPDIFYAKPGATHERWRRAYGDVFMYPSFLGSSKLCVTDPKALLHIVKNAYLYPKPNELRGELAKILGPGLLFSEGEDHKRQRKMLNISFSPAQIAALGPRFHAHSSKMARQIARILKVGKDEETAKIQMPETAKWGKADRPLPFAKGEHTVLVDIGRWLARTTLDVIGDTGFGYQFHALDVSIPGDEANDGSLHKPSPLAAALHNMITSKLSLTSVRVVATALLMRFPYLVNLPIERFQLIKKSMGVMNSECHAILTERKAEVEAEIDGGGLISKDLLSVIIKANKSSDVKNRLTDSELFGQMTTFMVAGHETSSSTLSWAIHELSVNRDIQSQIRAEVRAAKAGGADFDNIDELNELPLLDAAVRETLRVCGPILGTIRAALADDVIPLATPITLPDGRQAGAIEVQAGQGIFVNVFGINTRDDVWRAAGAPEGDGRTWRPSRWIEAQAAKDNGVLPDGEWPGEKGNLKGGSLYSGIMSFMGGTRACIGYRFAIAEIKCVLAELLDQFEFIAVDGVEVVGRTNVVTRPIMNMPDGSQTVPVWVRPAPRSNRESVLA